MYLRWFHFLESPGKLSGWNLGKRTVVEQGKLSSKLACDKPSAFPVVLKTSAWQTRHVTLIFILSYRLPHLPSVATFCAYVRVGADRFIPISFEARGVCVCVCVCGPESVGPMFIGKPSLNSSSVTLLRRPHSPLFCLVACCFSCCRCCRFCCCCCCGRA